MKKKLYQVPLMEDTVVMTGVKILQGSVIHTNGVYGEDLDEEQYNINPF